MKVFFRNLLIFCCGFAIYMTFEGIWKATIATDEPESFTMGLLGGAMFLIVGLLNKWFTFEMPLLLQSVIGAVTVTASELVTGLIVNVWLKLGIWDYSNIPCNFLGQICLNYSILWIVLCMVCIIIDDWIRYFAYDEAKPHYHFIKWGKDNK